MQYNVITDYLDHWAEHEPDTVWLRELKESDSSEHTWAECRQQVAAAAAALEKRFGHGTRMLLLSRNCPHWFLADLAIIRSGNVTVPLFTTHPPSTAGYIAEFTESTVIFVGESPNWETIRPALPEGITVVALPGTEIEGEHITWGQLLAEGEGLTPGFESKPDDVISLVFTSGTTGLPKGVIQTHESNLIPIQRAYEFLGLDEKPRYFSYLPLSHIAERQIVEFSSMHNGGHMSFNESLEHLARDLATTKPQVFFGAPRVWEQLQQAVIGKFGGHEAFDTAMEADAAGIGALVLDGLGLSEAMFCLTAAAPTPPALIHWWRALGLPLVEGFGQTEAMGLIANTHDARKIGSIGRVVPGVELIARRSSSARVATMELLPLFG